MITKTITEELEKALRKAKLPAVDFSVELAKNMAHGDYASNVALIAGRQLGNQPKDVADEIVKNIARDADGFIDRIEVAPAGFINFWLSDKYYADTISKFKTQNAKFGWNGSLQDKKIIVEYTDPNVLKPFHIGHLMSNTIGESVSRLFESAGATVRRANYFSDAGLNLAMAVFGMRERRSAMPSESDPIDKRTQFLGECYVFGVRESGANPDAMAEVREINKIIYQKKQSDAWELYQIGRRWSLEHFENLYKRLDSRFDYLIPESEVAEDGLALASQALSLGIFRESEGAVVYLEERSHLHTRVFVNNDGLPTYEAKELGLTKRKLELFPFDRSIVLTGSEQNDYFKVVMKAIDELLPAAAHKTTHIGHGMLRLTSGKMSSRKGNVITAEELIAQIMELCRGNEEVAIGALKYAVLKQAPGRDIIFDMEKSVSLEGDSGPYLQYAYARARSVISKSQSTNSKAQTNHNYQIGENERKLLRMIARWEQVLESAQELLAPQIVTTYLTELASEWNAYYAANQIINEDNKELTSARLSLATVLAGTLKAGLWVLGIPVLERM